MLFLAAVIFSVYESLRIPFLLLDGRESLSGILASLPSDALKCLILSAVDSLLLWRLVGRITLKEWSRPRIALAVVGVFFFNLLVSLPLWTLQWWIAPGDGFAAHLRDMYVMTCLASLVINAWLLIWIADALQRKERMLATAQLHMLRGQLDPHFFFNSLSMGISLIESDPETATDYFLCLSKSMRYVLEKGMQQKVTLGEEIDRLQPYLRMMEMRFGNAMHIEWNIPDSGDSLVLPAGALMLVFENIAKHNLLSNDNPLRVCVTVADGRLTVTNTLRPVSSDSSFGIGRRSLEQAFSNMGADSVTMHTDNNLFITSFPLENPDY